MELLTYEWRRARTIRTTWITSFFVIAAVLAFTYLVTVATTDIDGNRVTIPPADAISQAVLGNPIVLVLVASLGAMAFGHEYRYGTIRLTLTAFPRRTGVFFAKLFMTLLIPLVVVAVSAVLSYGLLVALGATEPTAGVEVLDPTVTSVSWSGVAWNLAIFAVTYASLAFSLTVITRSHPLGIIGPLLLSLLETVLIGILGERFTWLPDVLPLSAMTSWFAGDDVARSVGVWAAWIVGLLVVGFVLLRRRDA